MGDKHSALMIYTLQVHVMGAWAGEKVHHGDETHNVPRTPICKQHLVNRDGVGILQHLHSTCAEVTAQLQAVHSMV